MPMCISAILPESFLTVSHIHIICKIRFLTKPCTGSKKEKKKKIAGTVREKEQWDKTQIVFSSACFSTLLHFVWLRAGSDPLWFEIMTWHRSQLLSHPASAG